MYKRVENPKVGDRIRILGDCTAYGHWGVIKRIKDPNDEDYTIFIYVVELEVPVHVGVNQVEEYPCVKDDLYEQIIE